jgi:hypothetical protein
MFVLVAVTTVVSAALAVLLIPWRLFRAIIRRGSWGDVFWIPVSALFAIVRVPALALTVTKAEASTDDLDQVTKDRVRELVARSRDEEGLWFMYRQALDRLERELEPGESVVELAHAIFLAHEWSTAGGPLAITSRRFLFVRKRPLRNRFVVMSVLRGEIASFESLGGRFGLLEIALRTSDGVSLRWSLAAETHPERVLAFLQANYPEQSGPVRLDDSVLRKPLVSVPQPLEKWGRDEPPGRLRPPM